MKGEVIERASNVTQKVEIADQIAFFQAAANNKIDELNSLIQEGMNVNSRNIDGNTALHFASINNNTESVIILLNKGADRNFVNLKGETALQMTQIAILNDFDPDNSYEDTITYLSAKEHISGGGVGGVATYYDTSHYEFAKALQDEKYQEASNKISNLKKIAEKKIADSQEGDENTRLPLSAKEHISGGGVGGITTRDTSHYEKYQEALKKLVDSQDIDGNTMLHYVVKFGNAEMVEDLLERGASLNIENGKRYTPLNLAISYGKNEIIKVMLEKESHRSYSATTRDRSNKVDLHSIRALIFNRSIDEDLIIGLISKELTRDDLNKKDQGGNTPLHFAAAYGRLEIVKFLLENKADSSLKNNEGKTALQIADSNKIYSNSPGVYINIVNALSPISKMNEKGNTALHFDASDGKIEKVKDLLTKGADPDMHDIEGNVALHFAVASNQFEAVELLLKYKASPNEANIEKTTPLHVATVRGNFEVVKLLLAHGADNSLMNIEGHTPLHLAAADGNAKIVEFLLKEKADPSLKNNQGETAFDFAFSYGRVEICELLKNKTAHPLGGSSKEAALVIPDCDDPSTSTGKRKVDEVSGEERAPKKPHNKERS